jgi:hypothetical protein
MSKNSSGSSRRKFINKITQSVLATAIVPDILTAAGKNPGIQLLKRSDTYSANDHVQVALIGAGGMGNADADTCSTVPGVKIIAACDLYDGRLESAKKKYGSDIFVTKEYQEILSR